MPWDFCGDFTVVGATLSWMDIQVSRVWVGSESCGSSQVVSPLVSMFLECLCSILVLSLAPF
ncbi:hypothetical protein K439DRAFT_929947 [Ramaria rubella]|nr:hypothetical protein K439DRAFT_929947 [Ramaria rubella]